jgi:maltokinase
MLLETRLVDRLELGRAGSLVVLDAVYADGSSERYACPQGRRGEEARPDAPLWRALASFVRSGELADGVAGSFTGQPGDEPPAIEGAGARFLTEDQSNTSVVLGERLVVKCYRRLVPGVHPEPELLAALSGLSSVPPFFGSLVHRTGGAETTLLCLQGLVLGPGGWEHVVGSLVETALGGPRALAAGAAGAASYGATAAELHVALARAFGVAPLSPSEAGRRAAAARARLAEAADVLRGDDLARFEAVAPALRAALDGLDAAAGAPAIRVHGDLNVGQFVHGPRGLVVVDFEGEPGLAMDGRRSRGTPLADLAGLLLSLDHTAAAAARRLGLDGRDAAPLDAWADAARAVLLASYREGIAGSPLVLDDALLRACEAEKECGEVLYAATTLPEWLYAPLSVLERRFSRTG